MPKKSAEPKPIGVITHFFGGINVGVVKFNKPTKVGERIKIKGATTNFEQILESMQYEHEDIRAAKKNQEVGIKVEQKVREGDEVFLAE